MIEFASRKIVAIAEAMIEMAPDGANMFRFGYAGGTSNDRRWGRKEIIVKNGTKPDIFTSGNESGEMVTPEVARIRDTTGQAMLSTKVFWRLVLAGWLYAKQ